MSTPTSSRAGATKTQASQRSRRDIRHYPIGAGRARRPGLRVLDAILLQAIDRGTGLFGCRLRVHAAIDVLRQRHLDVGDLEVVRRERAWRGVLEMRHDAVGPLAVG